MDREAVKFWRTRTGREVDVVLDTGGKIQPVEIKYKKRLKSSDFSGLEKFRAAYPDSAPGILVNLGVQGQDGRGFLRVSPFGLDGVLGDQGFG
jgi:predicted AAA+ superfamily ATPase